VLIYHTALANGYRLGGATFSHNYRAVAELPRQAAVDLAETAALAAGSARHRSLLL
jgi:hypothetical protein